ncbi:hypothetical protein HJ096_15625 [Vibrio parahaemolyticus]|nr:hypothetical protein [Vibrio parahaemolyticus]MBE4163370.1 hypothetical protein [Vibrio parahaemolyticus]TOK64397.1 hypothetical protein CGI14_23935 [Vibrio parahaemolyticus]TON57784.1 hypothetical protein CGH54_24180 [Vibrio parahaemolyticus]HCH3500097.1 hypothetical protein [Vibrio parahaemolyticus]
MNEYVTHGQLVEIIELFDHLSIVNAVIVVIVYDLVRYLLGKLVDYFN